LAEGAERFQQRIDAGPTSRFGAVVDAGTELLSGLPVVGPSLSRVANVRQQVNTGIEQSIAKAKYVMERARKVDSQMDAAIQSQIKNTPSGRRQATAPSLRDGLGPSVEARREAVGKKIKAIREMQEDPQRVVDATRQQIQDLPPDVAFAAARHNARVLTFLASKLPPQPTGSNLQPQLKNETVSDADIERMGRYVVAAEDPMSVMKDWKAGCLNRQGVETLAACYPDMYQRFRQKIQTALMETNKPLTYAQEINISQMLDIPGNRFLEPAFIQRQQEVWAAFQQQAPDGGPQKPKPKHTSDTGRRLARESRMTASDRIESRL
jgi:hypothetical protein